MIGLFVIYLACLILILLRKRLATFVIVLINVALGLLMLLYHATSSIPIRL